MLEKITANSQFITLQKFLQLTSAEIIFLREFHQLNKKHQKYKSIENVIITYIQAVTDVMTLIKLAELSPTFDKWCQHQKLTAFWDTAWSMMARNPTLVETEKDDSKEYRPLKTQPKISSFNLVRGMVFYDLANILMEHGLTKHNQSVLEYLDKAIQYGNFAALHALNLLDTDILMNIEERTVGLDKINTMLSRSHKLALMHGTPAYLELAKVCLAAARYHKQGHDSNACNAAYQMALQYLHAADICQSASAAASYNAINSLDAIENGKLFDIIQLHETINAHMVNDSAGQLLAKTKAQLEASRFNNPKPATTIDIPDTNSAYGLH